MLKEVFCIDLNWLDRVILKIIQILQIDIYLLMFLAVGLSYDLQEPGFHHFSVPNLSSWEKQSNEI